MNIVLDETEAAEDLVETPSPSSVPRRRPGLRTVAFAGLVLFAIGGFWFFHARGSEATDDAQVDGHLIPIASRVDGTIQDVHVEDNQAVKAGELLVELDPRDYQVASDQAKAQFNQAAAQLIGASPNLPITRITNESDLASDSAQIAAAEAALAAARQDLAGSIAKLKQSQVVDARAQADFKRYQTLMDKSEVSHADYDQYKATAEAQTQTVAANQAAVEGEERTVEQRQAQLEEEKNKLQETRTSAPLRLAIREADIKVQRASAESARAAYEKATLNVQYSHIFAPVAGVVTERSAELGARVSQGQQLLMIVQTDDLWVTANFKETQLARMHPGERAEIYVDALHEKFAGTVESMPAVTGSRTSVLPPENATGNYVKVIQRMPVRIRFNRGQRDLDKLRPGMSVEPKVYLE
jgi:membrane fusion protein, multidrug efflux system